MATATTAKPANEPARRLYSHVVVPPERRRYRFDNASLRKAARQYVAVQAKGDYTEEALRDRYDAWLAHEADPWSLGWCDSSSSAEEAEEIRRYWIECELRDNRFDEFTTKDAVLARYGPIEEWDVSKVTDMRNLFQDARTFNGDLSKWDVSNVYYMYGMFRGAHAFNGDLSKWDVSKVADMHYMFHDTHAFNGDLSKWDVSKVADMSDMFSYSLVFNGDLSKWDVSKVFTMYGMFHGTDAFNGDLSKWDVSNVAQMDGMFCKAKCFDCDLTKWNPGASSPYKMPAYRMLKGAKAFSGRVHPELLKRLLHDRASYGFARNGRWLWRLAREGVRPHVLARLAAYHLMELGARPDAEGNAPRGAIEAFREDF